MNQKIFGKQKLTFKHLKDIFHLRFVTISYSGNKTTRKYGAIGVVSGVASFITTDEQLQ